MAKTDVTDVAFVAVYAQDYETSYKFYKDVIGLKKVSDMSEHACYFQLAGEVGLYLEGDCNKVDYGPKTARTSFAIMVESAGDMHRKLRENGIEVIQDDPYGVGDDKFWFQFFDPSGNIIEVVGGK